MGTETFYATAAQVLPTLLIALSVEIAFVIQARFRQVEALHRRSMENEEPNYDKNLRTLRQSVEGWFRAAVVLASAFLIGELLAFFALGFSWFNALTFIGVSASFLVMTVAVLLVPLFRFLDSDHDEL